MRLDLLLDREPFDQIFVHTLREFLQDSLGWSGSITWESPDVGTTADSMLANGKLNVIYPRGINRELLRPFTREFAYHPSLIRRILQTLYVRFATLPVLDQFLSAAVVKIQPWPLELDDWCIIPGNHTLRIVDLKHDVCHVVLKHEFSRQFLSNEIDIRKKYPFLPTARFGGAAVSGGWFQEERISGLPLNRLPSHTQRDLAWDDARAAMSRLYAETSQRSNFSEWVSEVHSQCNVEIQNLPSVYDADDIKQLVRCCNTLVEAANHNGEHMVTVLTHGDFQPANILSVDGGGTTYIIDWEYSGRRACFYDALVCLLQTRSPLGLAERVRQFSDGEFDQKDWSWCFEPEDARELSKGEIALFLLEDLLVRLQEQRVPDLRRKSEGLIQLVSEIERVRLLSA
jgi:hypothetical protein